MVFENLSESKVQELFNNFKAQGMSDDDAFTEVYSIECSMDEQNFYNDLRMEQQEQM